MKIFVTGGMGSGKSTLTEFLAAHGATVLYADAIGHENLFDPEMKAELRAAFGDGVFDETGEVDRPALGRAAFSSPENTRLLDSITQPRLYARILERLAQLDAPDRVVVLEMAILDGRDDFAKHADMVVCVTASPEVRVARLVRYRNVSEEDARDRIARQADEGRREAISDYVLRNDGSLEEFEQAIDRWWNTAIPAELR